MGSFLRDTETLTCERVILSPLRDANHKTTIKGASSRNFRQFQGISARIK